MRHSSKASACRRELNSHNAAVPRTPQRWRWRCCVRAEDQRYEQSVPLLSLGRAAVGFGGNPNEVGVPWRRHRLCLVGTPLPNPSFKPSPNGVPRGPGRRYAVHFRHPGPRVTPSVPA